MRRSILLLMFAFVANSVWGQNFVTTWATAEQLTEPHNLPPDPGLSGNSLRQIVQVSIGGKALRLRLSNEFSDEVVEIEGIEIATALSAGESSDVDDGTTTPLLFGGSRSVKIAAGGTVASDVVKFRLNPRQNVAITIHYGQCSNKVVTGHPGSRTTSYLASGNTSDFAGAVETNHWCTINAIDVVAGKKANAIAILGNSITDGRGSTTNQQDRWPDQMSRELLKHKATKNTAVLNFGIGGNCVVRGGLGQPAAKRYMRDLFGQQGVKYIILFEGTNDLGGSKDGAKTAEEVVGVFKEIIGEARSRGIKVYGATITPAGKSFYDKESHRTGRALINRWIRTEADLDGVIDFDRLVQDPDNPEVMQSRFLYENDWLHLNAIGYEEMGRFAAENFVVYEHAD